jgi:CheY-like chemotaxis protein
VASRAVANAQKGIGAALDGFSRQLTQPDGSTVRSADELKNEINRLKREEIGQHLRGVAESVQPLRQWSQELVQECAPQLESVRALNASMAELIRPTVLVVDDDEFQRKMVGKLLEAENYQMIYAGNGIEALTLLRKARPDLILMDVMMPEMDGLETTRRLKATPQHSGVPVIMITGQSEGKIVVDSLKAGASDFVVKPFNKNTLIDKVARALSKAA